MMTPLMSVSASQYRPWEVGTAMATAAAFRPAGPDDGQISLEASDPAPLPDQRLSGQCRSDRLCFGNALALLKGPSGGVRGALGNSLRIKSSASFRLGWNAKNTGADGRRYRRCSTVPPSCSIWPTRGGRRTRKPKPSDRFKMPAEWHSSSFHASGRSAHRRNAASTFSPSSSRCSSVGNPGQSGGPG